MVKILLKIVFLLSLVTFYGGVTVGCSTLSPLNSGNGNGSGDSQEETRNTPPPNPEAPSSPILVAGGGNCPSGQCTEESHGGRDNPVSGSGNETAGDDHSQASNNSKSQPTQTDEGIDPDPNDSKFKPNP